jgi:site-specific recombinase XerD
MENHTDKSQNRTLASNGFDDVLLDFILSRQAMMCTQNTIRQYRYLLRRTIDWFDQHEITCPEEINSKFIRQFFSELFVQGCSDSYVHSYARVLKTFIRFMVEENYISEEIRVPMPKIAEKQLLVYNESQVKKILFACQNKRDLAFILFMLDTGLRNAEVRRLNWNDINLKTGVVRVIEGKGRKFRIVVTGVNTRRALLKYRSEIDSSLTNPVFQTQSGSRFTASGLRSWMMRLSERAKIHITPHALRRTFATLSIRAGMDVFQLQILLGHSSLEMTRHYVSLVDEDLIRTHKAHGPVDFIIEK